MNRVYLTPFQLPLAPLVPAPLHEDAGLVDVAGRRSQAASALAHRVTCANHKKKNKRKTSKATFFSFRNKKESKREGERLRARETSLRVPERNLFCFALGSAFQKGIFLFCFKKCAPERNLLCFSWRSVLERDLFCFYLWNMFQKVTFFVLFEETCSRKGSYLFPFRKRVPEKRSYWFHLMKCSKKGTFLFGFTKLVPERDRSRFIWRKVFQKETLFVWFHKTCSRKGSFQFHLTRGVPESWPFVLFQRNVFQNGSPRETSCDNWSSRTTNRVSSSWAWWSKRPASAVRPWWNATCASKTRKELKKNN